MMRVAICDDDKNIRANLISIVRMQNTDCEIVEYASMEECLSDSREFDLVVDRELLNRAMEQIIAEAEQRKKTLVIQYEGTSKTIPIDDIYYVESQNHKVILHRKEGNLEYYGRIGKLEEELREQFFRIHKGYLINLIFVDRFSKTEVTLANNDKLPISKYKYADFVKVYLRFMEQREG